MFRASIALVVLFSLQSLATVVFHNSGTKSGWDEVFAEHHGSVDQVTDVVYKGSSALRFTQIYDQTYDGRYHSEVRHLHGYKRGETFFYGFAFLIPRTWQFQKQSYNIAQFIGDFNDDGCNTGFIPNTMVYLIGNQLYSRYSHGTPCNRQVVILKDLTTVTPGEWHTIVINAKWESSNTGFFKLWYDGKQVFDRENIATTLDADREFEFRVGLYANGWHDEHNMEGSEGNRRVWHDEVTIGSTYAEVDPSKQ